MRFPGGALLRAFSGKATPVDVDASSLACVGVAGYFLGLAFPVSATLDLPLVFLVLLCVAAAIVEFPKHPARHRSLIVIPMLAFVAARLASLVVAPPAVSGAEVVAPLLPALLVFFVLSEWVRTRRHVVAIYTSLTAAGLALSTTYLVTAGLSGKGFYDTWASRAPSALLVVNNDLTVVAVLAPLAMAAALILGHPLVRLLVAAFFVALVVVIGVAQSRTALLTALVSVACFAGLTRGRGFSWSRRGWLVIAGAISTAVVVDAVLGFPLGRKLLGEWQGSGRLSLWAAAFAMFQDAPVLGQGPQGFLLHHRAYIDALQLPAWVRIEDRVTPWAHNLYLELLAEQGVLGLATFLGMVGAGVATLGRILRSRQPDVRLLGAGAGAALVAFLAAAPIELSLIRAWVTIVLFTLLGLLTTITRIEQESRA